jgi:hypothetical protein
LLEIALPGLRRRPPERIMQFLGAVDRVVHADGHVEVFEYLMVRTIKQYLWESVNPHKVRASGQRRLERLRDDALALLAVLARHGHPSDEQAALQAWTAGAETLFEAPGSMPAVDDWAALLDAVLDHLDELRAEDKQRLVQAMLVIVSMDERLLPEELELLRVACMGLHVPIPALLDAAQVRGGD